MIREVVLQNFKSIQDLSLDLGRINIFIGENGSGKSNILEGVALAAAAAQRKLDNEFLASRGIRVTEPRFMRSAFDAEHAMQDIALTLRDDAGVEFQHRLRSDDSPTFSRWQQDMALQVPEGVRANLDKATAALLAELEKTPENPVVAAVLTDVRDFVERVMLHRDGLLPEFLIYSPENSALRVFQAEGQILPLGVKGEGLFAHLKALSQPKNLARLTEITDKLALLDWFDHFEIPADLALGERALRIRDRYLAEGALFDQRSANEGFLFLLFYFTLFISPDTPAFFAIDNVDASLNPKLCSALVRELVNLAKIHEKQAILTTHNPAVLDGLDLHDDEQRLFVIDRDNDGHTRARRVPPPRPLDGEPPVKLSEAFLRGYIGGLPQNF